MRRILAALAAVLIASPTDAEWMRASSPHFIVFADAPEPEVREMATRLERFDASLRRFHGVADSPAAQANRVTVFITSNLGAIRKLAGRKDVGGFYLPWAEGPVAFAPRKGISGANGISGQTVLFHEYAHHFMLGAFPLAYPAWYAEGYAELMSTAEITPDQVRLGLAANHRANGVLLADNMMPVASLFAPPERMSEVQQEQLYGRGWLLTHFITFDAKRRAQMGRYLELLNGGTPSLEAAGRAFGVLDLLDAELYAYLAQPTIPVVRYAAAKLPPARVEVRPASAGERALMELRIVSERGVDERTAGPLYARAKRAAVPAGDAEAQGWLAEMAYDAGLDAEAEVAADRALAADPRSVQALIYKARVRLRRAGAVKSTDPKVWREARSWAVKARDLRPDAAGPLELYYESFAAANEKPPADAVAGLRRAVALMPQNPDLRFTLVAEQLGDGAVEEAKRTLRPLAYNPHLGRNNPAAKLLAALDAGKSGEAALKELQVEGEARQASSARAPAPAPVR